MFLTRKKIHNKTQRVKPEERRGEERGKTSTHTRMLR